jgi:hypothetical protein
VNLSLLRFLIVVLGVLVGSQVSAQVITAGEAPYDTPAIVGVSIQSDFAVRTGALTSAAGIYRTLGGNGLGSLPQGSRFTLIYTDGSSEQGLVGCIVGTACVEPIPGTQVAGDGNVSGEGGLFGGPCGSLSWLVPNYESWFVTSNTPGDSGYWVAVQRGFSRITTQTC